MSNLEKDPYAYFARLAEFSITPLETDTTRTILVAFPHGQLRQVPFDEFTVRNQQQFGIGPNHSERMVTAHRNMGIDAVGVREVRTRRLLLFLGGEEIEFTESYPFVSNTWVGEGAMLYTPEQASRTIQAGRTALEWATVAGITPERVARVRGYFYPATLNDTAIPLNSAH